MPRACILLWKWMALSLSVQPWIVRIIIKYLMPSKSPTRIYLTDWLNMVLVIVMKTGGALFGIMRSEFCIWMTRIFIAPRINFMTNFPRSIACTKRISFLAFHYKMRASLRDPSKLGQKYVNNSKLWLETEAMVRNVLYQLGCRYSKRWPMKQHFTDPKLMSMKSAIGRWFTMATNQVEFSSAEKFNLTFKNSNNEEERPLIIHRAPLGTHERYIGFLIEHFAGQFPLG